MTSCPIQGGSVTNSSSRAISLGQDQPVVDAAEYILVPNRPGAGDPVVSLPDAFRLRHVGALGLPRPALTGADLVTLSAEFVR
mgnify:CR=1 FL=1